MDTFEAAAQPKCPRCRTVLRDDPRGFACLTCGVVFTQLRELLSVAGSLPDVRRHT